MFTGVMNLMMNTAMGRPMAPGGIAPPAQRPSGEPRSVRLRAVTPRPAGAPPASRAAGLATYQIYAEAFRAATRAR
ncbi:MAG: hypothetical protein R3286_12435 [Gammaproteobacteria bacterium]|nr:hypothetical protein [Gammaproteobacteria bacterium]